MRCVFGTAGMAFALAFVPVAFAADANNDVVDCIPKTIFICATGKDNCNKIPVVDVQGAHRIRLNLKMKTSQAFEGDVKISESRIDRIERHENLMFLQGHEVVEKRHQLLNGWTAIVDSQTGRLTISSIADGLGFVLDGRCSVGKGGEQ